MINNPNWTARTGKEPLNRETYMAAVHAVMDLEVVFGHALQEGFIPNRHQRALMEEFIRIRDAKAIQQELPAADPAALTLEQVPLFRQVATLYRKLGNAVTNRELDDAWPPGSKEMALAQANVLGMLARVMRHVNALDTAFPAPSSKGVVN